MYVKEILCKPLIPSVHFVSILHLSEVKRSCESSSLWPRDGDRFQELAGGCSFYSCGVWDPLKSVDGFSNYLASCFVP